MKSILCFLAVFAFLSSSYSTSSARTWYIKHDGTGDAPTIQAGIDSAGTGDVVLLSRGSFTGVGNRNIDFKGKAITVKSKYGPAETVIGLPSDDSIGFVFQSGEGYESALTGITIKGGGSYELELDAIAIKCVSSSPTITSNRIYELWQGHAIYCVNSSPVIRNNVIESISPGPGWGVAIECLGGSPQIVGNLVRGNAHPYWPAGEIIVCSNGSPTLHGNSIVDNWCPFGAVILNNCSAEIISNIIARNAAGLRCVGTSGASTVVHNTVVENDLFNIECYNATVMANIVAYGGTGLTCDGSTTVSCCVVFSNAGGDTICGIDGGGNMIQDPRFCEPPGSGVYTLYLDSPCLPANNSCGQLIGALTAACGGGVYVECPPDTLVPAHSSVPHLDLRGFVIANIHDSPLSFTYSLQSSGPAALVDNGNAASLSGTTPVIEPGGSYTPPEAALDIPDLRDHCQQIVTYDVDDPVIAAIVTGTTTITFEPPVPVFITAFDAVAVERAVELVWDILSDEDVKGFRIYCSAEGSRTPRLVNYNRLIPSEAREYVDRDVQAGCSYEYTLGVVLKGGSESISQTATVETKAYEVALHQNHPNPFNPSTAISFTLPKREKANLSVYNIEGKLVATLINETLDAGFREVTWHGEDSRGNQVSTGVYFYRLTAGNRTLTKKMVLLK